MKKQESGQSLIEVLAAIAVTVLVILALVTATTISVRNMTFASKQSLATQYAREAIEEVRAFRDSDPDSFFAGSCPSFEEIEGFTRTVTCESNVVDRVRVIVTVTWVDAKGTHKSNLETYLTRW
ncbi:MAG TPA: hypothetical protein VMY36_04020 [Patescibacteria group bacterium]|nr:hypothetical protein [Patescibacteria group bacterium]